MSDIDFIKAQLERIEDKLDKACGTIHGEGEQPGLKGRVDRLEQIEAWRKWVVRGLGGAILVQVANTVVAWFKTPN